MELITFLSDIISDDIKRYISVDTRIWAETLFLRIQVKKIHKSKNATREKNVTGKKLL